MNKPADMDRPGAIDGLGDAALLAAADRWQPWSFSFATVLYAAAVLPLVIGAMTFIFAGPYWGFGTAVGTFFASSLVLSEVQTTFQQRQGPNPWEGELRRRAGPSSALHYKSYALPHGNRRVAWIDLDRRRFLFLEKPPPEDTSLTQAVDTAISEDEAAGFMAAIGEVAGPTDSNERFEVTDGCPFDLVIHATVSTVLTGNLAANGAQFAGWRLARLIEDAMARRGAGPALYGATDFDGNVAIGRY